MTSSGKNSGFTLIETILYIALFSLLIGTAFVTVYQLIDSSGKLNIKNTTQGEGNFVLRKINWTMIGTSTFSISGSELTINKYDGITVKIKLGSGADAGKILMDDTGSFVPITTNNVQVTDLQFQQIGTDLIGVSVVARIKTLNTNPLDFIITKYIRQ
ncbi:hypothetical protein A3B85_00770 [Candidatus Nomurabacteria bacterium RIFCSPHIGHO2_02_FULL_37_13]|uniref:Prepilin-type N-terminal cleavage/methylation domain-containing protein n=1 Tax=Candidatus Nomurabacteria bacterium RIFCSPHIGHO2_02_FULL_37_13 TaxID=1801750 RepID=A0A1F6W527_9BACT|nr:MAG: hypothetical protein A2640_03140 [Candidatus Nomurabacteria bacterium RIFCSPHIGHO2_01_FULL_36_23]OGI77013.1 MAG: hypothetical protein A3B85_00770 [Candidatus Nomurabacteria bacterium RIFCSPHIGHO2_02_FULL_37_13]OGI88611.1 MAG: hypothetical protein A2906_03240 [Candidatus Nomurabacteria bacterium RIFCSPLOWO2_01_FULL_37_25]